MRYNLITRAYYSIIVFRTPYVWSQFYTNKCLNNRSQLQMWSWPSDMRTRFGAMSGALSVHCKSRMRNIIIVNMLHRVCAVFVWSR